jgi:hypothetical protein
MPSQIDFLAAWRREHDIDIQIGGMRALVSGQSVLGYYTGTEFRELVPWKGVTLAFGQLRHVNDRPVDSSGRLIRGEPRLQKTKRLKSPNPTSNRSANAV